MSDGMGACVSCDLVVLAASFRYRYRASRGQHQHQQYHTMPVFVVLAYQPRVWWKTVTSCIVKPPAAVQGIWIFLLHLHTISTSGPPFLPVLGWAGRFLFFAISCIALVIAFTLFATFDVGTSPFGCTVSN